MTETSVALASGQTSRNVVGIATSAISSGTTAINDAKTNDEHEQRAAAGDRGLDGQARPARLAAVGRAGAQRVQAGDLDGRAADGDARRARPAPRAPRPGRARSALGRDVDERERRAAVGGDEGRGRRVEA